MTGTAAGEWPLAVVFEPPVAQIVGHYGGLEPVVLPPVRADYSLEEYREAKGTLREWEHAACLHAEYVVLEFPKDSHHATTTRQVRAELASCLRHIRDVRMEFYRWNGLLMQAMKEAKDATGGDGAAAAQ